MKKLLPILIIVIAALIGVAGGVGARMFVPSAPSSGDDSKEEHASEKKVSHGGENSHEKAGGHGKKSKTKGGHGEASATSEFVKFSRQFIAPVMENGKPTGLMIMDVNFEVTPDTSSLAYASEPKLRDAVLRVLLQQASSGELARLFADPEVLERTKAEIMAEAQKILGDGVISILIMDVGYQRY